MGNSLAVVHAHTDEGEDTEDSRELSPLVGNLTGLWFKESIELLDKMRIEVEERLVEVRVEVFQFSISKRVRLQLTKQLVHLVRLEEGEEGTPITVDRSDTLLTAIEIDSEVFVLLLVGSLEAVVSTLELLTSIVELVHLAAEEPYHSDEDEHKASEDRHSDHHILTFSSLRGSESLVDNRESRGGLDSTEAGLAEVSVLDRASQIAIGALDVAVDKEHLC